MTDLAKRIAELSPEKRKLLMHRLEQQKEGKLQPIPRQGRETNTFLMSFSQQRLWILEQLEPGSAAYSIPVAIRLKGSLNLSALEQSLSAIVGRHEVLRTTFTTVDERLVQNIHLPGQLRLSVIDLQTFPIDDKEKEVQRLISNEALKPFDLVQGPLIRASLLKLNETEHTFLLTMHHIVSDAWSVGVFIGELRTLYEAFCMGESALLPELPIQYADFAQWQHEWLSGETLERQLTYWKEQLSSPLPVLHLPTDYSRPKLQTFNGARETVTLSETLTQRLKELGRQEDCTLFMVLLAAFNVLLYRNTGQSDILVGSPIAGRNRAEMESLIGFFLNTLVLRTNLDGNPSFRELLKHVRETALEAYANQDIPFEKLLEELHVERDLSRTPLFQVFFNMLNVNSESIDLLGLKGELINRLDAEAKFDLTLYIVEQNKQIHFIFVYNTDLFRQERMAEMMRQLEWLLTQIIASPDTSIDEYSLVTTWSRQILPDPRMELAEPEQILLPEMIKTWAKQTPYQAAIMQSDRHWTYAELDEQASRLARRLVSKGLKPGHVVAVCGSRSFNLIASMLAVFSSGGVLLPIDNDLPKQRKQLMLQDASAKALIYIGGKPAEDIAWADKIEPENILVLSDSLTNSLIDETETAATSICLPQLSGNDAAYIFFTSGTTGVPKGVKGNHKGLSHFLSWQRSTFGIRTQDRAAQLTALSFDVVLRDVFLALVSGATLCLPEDKIERDAEATLKWLRNAKISIVHTVPTLAQMWLGSHAETSLLDLSRVFFAGEPLKDALVHQWREHFPHCQIVNLYGPTETTMAKCFYAVPEQIFPGIQPVGCPLPQTQALVINKVGQLCGIGEPGEIVLRTPFRTLGYINAPEDNSRKFVKNPFRQDEQDLVYHTGDQGRYRPDGQLDILGRIDDQVKIRGNRIELSEIELALSQHPAVKQAVVSLWETEPGDKYIIAHVIPNDMQFPKTHELRGYLQQYLPSYMIPASFTLIDTVPLTPNGKINRKALPNPNIQIEQESFVAAQTQLQELLAGIWADVLRLEQIGIQDNFFDLGGHSLLATQIMSRVRQIIKRDLPLRVLFEFPTIATMSAYIESLQRADNFDIPPLKPYTRHKPPRLSFSQERMWFIHQLAPESTAYNISNSVRIQGKLDPKILEQAFNIVIDRHEILRTTFDLVEGEPVQVVAPSRPISLPVIPLDTSSDMEKNNKANEMITSAAKEPFDLRNGPLIRVFLIRLGDNDHILFSAVHHIVSDQWSSGVFSREITIIYNALSTNSPILLPDLSIQYADYSMWQRGWLQGDSLNAKLTFWKTQLEGISVLDLPTDFPRPAMQTHNGSDERLTLSASLIDAVRNLCRQEKVTPFMFFLSIYKILLLRYTGQQDVVVGSPIANRNWLETENLIGTFVNTVVFRTQLKDNPTFRDFLHYVRELSLDAFNHQDFPFEKLVEELQPERDMSHSPLVQVLFNMQNAPMDIPQLYNNPSLTPIWFQRSTAQFDLNLSVSADLHPQMVLSYNTDLFNKDTIIRMLGHLESLIKRALEDPNQRLLDLPMLTEAERKTQLIDWNDTRLDYPQFSSIHQLVEAQAEKTPDAFAVVFENQQVTYRELNERSNQLACHLQTLGVEPETPVGISVERSAEMVIGLLGILKAGGTYIPLDPLFPQDRLEYMLENSETRILLTQKRIQSQATRGDGLLIVNLDSDWDILSQYPVKNLPVNTHPDNLAYTIFTSGSTGKPKGVQILHRAVVNFLTSMRQKPGLMSNDRLLSVTTLSFDISVLEVFLPLTTGACIVVVPGDVIYDGAALIEHLSNNNITVMQATPATWQMLMDAGWQGDRNLKVLCGGEAMPKDLAKWLTEHVGSVWNMYGPTETTVWSTLCEITHDTEVITIGRPIANTQIYILDQNLEPTPIGVSGELYIAGDGVAHGYLKQPELTAEKFLPDPFRNQPGAYMYKTGDQARYLTDGQIDFLGRADFQVKVRGFRIELGEIETVLNSHPDVRQAVVIAREDSPGDKRLVAYLISETDQGPEMGELRQFIKMKLPEYMVPSSFVFLNEFPMTPNRKVNRKALPSPDPILHAASQEHVPARNTAEEKLVKIWEELLRVRPIGIHNNFFELGGHSLLGVRLFSRIKEEFGINLPLATLFKETTIEELAAAIHQQTGPSTWSSLIEIEPQGNHPPFFCIHGVTGDILWFRDLAQCLAPEYPFYGLQARGLDGIQEPFARIDAMAKYYIEEIRLRQPSGPYYLGGASFGGTVALEIAQQLLEMGEEVALLAVFDHSPENIILDMAPNKFRNRLVRSGKLIRNFPYWLKEFLQLGPSRIWMRVRRKMRLARKAKSQLGVGNLEQFDATDIIDFATELPLYRQQLITCHFHAMNTYVPKMYPGHVTLFRAKSRPLLNTFDPEAGWQKLAPGRVNVVDIPSSHEGMFRIPHVNYLAKQLKKMMDQASENNQH